MHKKQDLQTFKLPPNFRGKNPFIVQFWWIVQGVLFRTSPQFLYGWRRFLLRMFGAQIGKNVIIRPTVRVTYPWKLKIGDYSWIGDDVVLYNLGNINIGSNTVISQKSYICTGSHDYSEVSFPIYAKEIHIEDECWLATDVFVAPGITIGKQSVVGSRSSVYKNIPAGKIAYGNPAKVVKDRN